jgi:hypothetical protein
MIQDKKRPMSNGGNRGPVSSRAPGRKRGPSAPPQAACCSARIPRDSNLNWQPLLRCSTRFLSWAAHLVAPHHTLVSRHAVTWQDKLQQHLTATGRFLEILLHPGTGRRCKLHVYARKHRLNPNYGQPASSLTQGAGAVPLPPVCSSPHQLPGS